MWPSGVSARTAACKPTQIKLVTTSDAVFMTATKEVPGQGGDERGKTGLLATYMAFDSVECTKTGLASVGRVIVVALPIAPNVLAGLKVVTVSSVPSAR